ncbi:carbohydrate ABC transporter permease [Micromonospora sp. URMC 103]|uniref:carbohydrate ABC transporter permease n=1 Tax=Micromonospora sp. URMC 103 TaxID=3423406 RepID=UPI003F1D90DD
MLGFLVVVLIPLVAVLLLSFTDSNLLAQDVQPVGLDNYQTMATEDPAFWRAVVTTGIFAIGLVVINVALSLFLALVLHRKLRGAQLFLALAFLPVVTSQAAWAIVWRFLLQGEGGTINSLLSAVSIIGPNWLFEAKPALAAVIVVAALKTVGLKAVIFLAALRNIPKEAIEAARLDGAGEWQMYRRVILPLLAPTTLVVVIITFIGSFQVFDYILLMTNGGPSHATTVLAFAIYQQGFELMRTGYASALAVVLFAITLALVAVQWWARKKWVHSE